MKELIQILIFPGLFFLMFAGLAFEFVDRKLHARFQNRIGPPYFQPLADIIKLFSKETIIPGEADRGMMQLMPVLAMTCAVISILYIPLFNTQAIFSFEGDIIVILYLLTIPTMTLFLAGWHSVSLFSLVGAIRSITQLFAYEVPFFMALLAPAILANTWELSKIAQFYAIHPHYALANIIGFVVSIIALLGKLEKVPFDIPEAETEIVAGPLTEYSGWPLAIYRLTLDIEMVVGAALIAAIFFPIWFAKNAFLAFILFIIKIFVVIAILTLLRTLFARLRIEQMLNFWWKYLAPAALIQLFINLVIRRLI